MQQLTATARKSEPGESAPPDGIGKKWGILKKKEEKIHIYIW